MDCPMCFTSYKEPKRLPCSHTICIECVEWNLTKGDGTEPTVKCPVCMTRSRVPDGLASNLPTNLFWQKIQKVYKEYPPEITELGKCYFCQQKARIVDMRYCQDCHVDMCAKCAITHTQKSVFNGHQIQRLIKIRCKYHPHTCDYICVTCDKFLCRACVQSDICCDHPDSITTMDALKEEKLRSLQEYETQMSEKITFVENDVYCQLENIKKKLELISDVKSKVQNHVDKLIRKIKFEENNLLRIVDKWEEPFLEAKARLNSRCGDKPLVQELLESTKEGLKGEIEHMLITESLIKSTLPPTRNILPLSNLDTSIKFVPEDTIYVGQLYGTTIDFKKAPVLKWNRGGLEFAYDVVFTPSGKIVACDSKDNSVIMYDGMDSVISNSKDRGVNIEGPCCVTYDPSESALIINDKQDHLISPSDIDLTMMWKVKLEGGIDRQYGVGVLSDGSLVVGTDGPNTISVYDRQGRRLRYITHYGHRKQYQVLMSCYIRVLSDDIIVVSMWKANHVVYLSADLQCLQVVDIMCPGGLTLSPQGDILVRGRNPNCIHHLWGPVGQIHADVVMEFSDSDIMEYGWITSIAMMDNQLVVLFEHDLHLYHWPGCYTWLQHTLARQKRRNYSKRAGSMFEQGTPLSQPSSLLRRSNLYST